MPDDFTSPVFEFLSYKIPIVSENWPSPGSSVARITATSPTNTKIVYDMYSSEPNDNSFRIKPNTGGYYCFALLLQTVWLSSFLCVI